jgi:hypothetical protein
MTWAGRPSFRQTLRRDLTRSKESTKTRASNVKTLLPLLLGLLYSTTAFAQTSEEWDGDYGSIAKRRSGFAMGADFGLGLGGVDGYPNDAVKLNDSRYRADTGFAAGTIGRAWLGGTIRDWFSFGLGLETLRMQGNGLIASGGGFILRPEVYPLWSLGGAYRDLGAYADFGLGWMKTRRDAEIVADGGSLGLFGVGLFHETLRWHHLGVGPTLGCALYFSQTLTATVAQVGLRIAFTSGP